jgi:hypothetical protein
MESERKLGKEIDGRERGEEHRRLDGAGYWVEELEKGGKRNEWSRVGRRILFRVRGKRMREI